MFLIDAYPSFFFNFMSISTIERSYREEWKIREAFLDSNPDLWRFECTIVTLHEFWNWSWWMLVSKSHNDLILGGVKMCIGVPITRADSVRNSWFDFWCITCSLESHLVWSRKEKNYEAQKKVWWSPRRCATSSRYEVRRFLRHLFAFFSFHLYLI